MRYPDDEPDPKQPRPVRGSNKPTDARETPWRLVRKDDDRDRHRHVV